MDPGAARTHPSNNAAFGLSVGLRAQLETKFKARNPFWAGLEYYFAHFTLKNDAEKGMMGIRARP